jgi:hypothetical protein
VKNDFGDDDEQRGEFKSSLELQRVMEDLLRDRRGRTLANTYIVE